MCLHLDFDNYSFILNCYSIEEFIPLLKERMNVLNPYVRQFLVGWITVLDSVPDIDMLGFLPDFLDGNIFFIIRQKYLLYFINQEREFTYIYI